MIAAFEKMNDAFYPLALTVTLQRLFWLLKAFSLQLELFNPTEYLHVLHLVLAVHGLQRDIL